MAYPGVHAQTNGDKPAVIIVGSGEVQTYRELDERSNQLAHLLRGQGLQRGDRIALFMENQIRYMEIVWAALRSGLYVTPINSYLTTDEVAYIIDDCDAQLVITSRAKAEVAAAIDPSTTPTVDRWLMTDGLPAVDSLVPFESYEDAISEWPTTKIDDESPGYQMLYSSGTTGRPKGIVRGLPDLPIDQLDPKGTARFSKVYQYGPDMTYLSPAPMYHAAPLAFSSATHRFGGTLVIMEKFDANGCLAALERFEATHSQFVPTMFVRMLKLDAEQREAHDLSKLKVAIHAAAPCPVEVKRQMIEWWGPVIYEYYAGSEGNGATIITSQDWLTKPGSVGKAVTANLHICDADGNELAPGEIGGVYFSGGGTFSYHKNPEKTAEASLPGGRTTLGDVGYVDEDGYLFLTDRKAHMIISGGVNIYPQEVEDALVTHPKVADVAVFGVPDPDMGEQVKAVVEPAAGIEADDALGAELINHARATIAHYKCPKSVDFTDALPRLPTGKLYKRLLRDRYWGNTDSTIV